MFLFIHLFFDLFFFVFSFLEKTKGWSKKLAFSEF